MQPLYAEDLQKEPSEFAIAGIAHLSFLFGQVVLPGILLAVMREKSEYVRFQIAQALAAQVAMFLLVFLYALLFTTLIFASMPTAGAPQAEPPPMLMVLVPIHFLVVIGTLVANLVLTVLGAIRGFQGQDWVIPVVGSFVFSNWFQGRRAAV